MYVVNDGEKNQLMTDNLMVSVEEKSMIKNQVRVLWERELRNSNGCSSKALGRKVSDKFEAQAFFSLGLLTVNAASVVWSTEDNEKTENGP